MFSNETPANTLAVNYVFQGIIPVIEFSKRHFNEGSGMPFYSGSPNQTDRDIRDIPFEVINGEAVLSRQQMRIWFHVLINELKDLVHTLSSDPRDQKLNGAQAGQLLGIVESLSLAELSARGRRLSKPEMIEAFARHYHTYSDDSPLPENLSKEEIEWLDKRVKEATFGEFSNYKEFMDWYSVHSLTEVVREFKPTQPDSPQSAENNKSLNTKIKEPTYTKALLENLIELTTSKECRAKAQEALNNGFNISIEQITKLCTMAPVQAFGIQFNLKSLAEEPQKVLAFLRILKSTEKLLERSDVKQEVYIQNFIQLVQQHLKEPINVSEKKIDKAYMANRGSNELFLMPDLFNDDSYGDFKGDKEKNSAIQAGALLNEAWDLLMDNMLANRPNDLAYVNSSWGQITGFLYSSNIAYFMWTGQYMQRDQMTYLAKNYAGPNGENAPSGPLPENQVPIANELIRNYTRVFNSWEELAREIHLLERPNEQDLNRTSSTQSHPSSLGQTNEEHNKQINKGQPVNDLNPHSVLQIPSLAQPIEVANILPEKEKEDHLKTALKVPIFNSKPFSMPTIDNSPQEEAKVKNPANTSDYSRSSTPLQVQPISAPETAETSSTDTLSSKDKAKLPNIDETPINLFAVEPPVITTDKPARLPNLSQSSTPIPLIPPPTQESHNPASMSIDETPINLFAAEQTITDKQESSKLFSQAPTSLNVQPISEDEKETNIFISPTLLSSEEPNQEQAAQLEQPLSEPVRLPLKQMIQNTYVT
jgi:hypothetical protein